MTEPAKQLPPSITDKAAKSATAQLSRAAPWRSDIDWYWVAAEGAIAAAIGAYFLLAPDAANSTIRLLLAIILLLSSALDIFTGFRNYRLRIVHVPMTPFLLVRGGFGIAVAGMFLIGDWQEYFDSSEEARLLLGIGFLLYAGIGLVGNLASLLTGGLRWMSVGSNIVFALFGIVMVYNDQQVDNAEDRVSLLGYAGVGGGAILLIYSYLLRQKQEQEPTLEEADAEAGAALAQSVAEPVTATTPVASPRTEPELPDASTRAEQVDRTLDPPEKPTS